LEAAKRGLVGPPEEKQGQTLHTQVPQRQWRSASHLRRLAGFAMTGPKGRLRGSAQAGTGRTAPARLKESCAAAQTTAIYD